MNYVGMLRRRKKRINKFTFPLHLFEICPVYCVMESKWESINMGSRSILNGLLSFGMYVRGIGYEESCGIASI
jgi:hypothetical protein